MKNYALSMFCFVALIAATPVSAKADDVQSVSLQVAQFAADVQGFFNNAAQESAEEKFARALETQQSIAAFEASHELSEDQRGLLKETEEALANYAVHPSAK